MDSLLEGEFSGSDIDDDPDAMEVPGVGLDFSIVPNGLNNNVNGYAQSTQSNNTQVDPIDLLMEEILTESAVNKVENMSPLPTQSYNGDNNKNGQNKKPDKFDVILENIFGKSTVNNENMSPLPTQSYNGDNNKNTQNSILPELNKFDSIDKLLVEPIVTDNVCISTPQTQSNTSEYQNNNTTLGFDPKDIFDQLLNEPTVKEDESMSIPQTQSDQNSKQSQTTPASTSTQASPAPRKVVSVNFKGKVMKINTAKAVAVTPELLKSMGLSETMINQKLKAASSSSTVVNNGALSAVKRPIKIPAGLLNPGLKRNIQILKRNPVTQKINQTNGFPTIVHNNKIVKVQPTVQHPGTPNMKIISMINSPLPSRPSSINGVFPNRLQNSSAAGSSNGPSPINGVFPNRLQNSSAAGSSNGPSPINGVFPNRLQNSSAAGSSNGPSNIRFSIGPNQKLVRVPAPKQNNMIPLEKILNNGYPSTSRAGIMTNGNNTQNLTYKQVMSTINKTLISHGISDPGVVRFVQKNLDPNSAKRKLVPDHNYNISQSPKRSRVTLEEVENEMELGVAETYSTYMPAKLKLGRKHPDPVVETASLSSVAPVDVFYKLSIPRDVIDNGVLSALQLESITYASQAHEQILPNGNRAGFLIGDGAGVGKGRTIAGIILENYLKGRERAVWVSISNDLKYDAERDLQDIGAKFIPVHQLNKIKYNSKISSESNGSFKRGVLFCTYSSLIGESTSTQGKYVNRKNQILQWCRGEFDGLLIFDECHKAKNLCPSGSMKSTKTGQIVLELQESLPKARVLYASATGASEPKNMAYMTRLGLWGEGTTFKTFDDFTTAVEEKGVGGMEIVAMDMKLRGMYIARQLSFQDVKFTIKEVPLSQEFIKIYNTSVKLWTDALAKFTKAASLVAASNSMKKTMWGQFWSAHQRYFKYLCIAAKVNEAVKLAHNAMKYNNCCVVIGLQSTGESGTLDQLERGEGELTEFVSTAKGVFQNLVEKHFPASNRDNVNKILSSISASKQAQNKPKEKPKNGAVKLIPEREILKKKQMELLKSLDSDDDSDDSFNFDDDDDGNESDASNQSEKERLRRQKEKEEENEQTNNMLQFIFSKHKPKNFTPPQKPEKKVEAEKLPTSLDIEEANEMKESLLKRIESLGKKLPKNTLDELIDNLGGPEEVAEMTGRKGRVVQTENGVQYQTRSEQDVPLETLNVKEKQRFMDGEKMVAIISEAASSGISLQSDRRAINKKKRYHITLELPWSADKAVQQFGRTHRSNQVSAPEYVFLITDLAGERRFASIVAKRLESLGALTHGDRRASDNKDLSQFNIDNKYGKSALESVMKAIVGKEAPLIPPPKDYKGNFFHDVIEALIGVGLILRDGNNLTLEKDYNNISKFLNRILGMPVDLQNRLFKYFTDTMNTIIGMAKRNGSFDLGILDLGTNDKDVIRRVQTIKFMYKHATGVAPIELHKLIVERGMSWNDAMQKYRDVSDDCEGFYESHQTTNNKRYVILLTKVESSRGSNNSENVKFRMYRPNTGRQNKLVTIPEITLKYRKVEPRTVQNLWIEQYNSTVCSHKYWNGECNSGLKCESGLRRRTYHVLAGAVLPIWLKIEAAITEKTSMRSHKNKMQVIRLKTVNDLKIVGTLIKNNLVEGLISVLRNEAEKFEVQDYPDT